ncbi:M1 family metallopeptidase [Mangrovimonas aestuarii]|uniref:M1 family metallopeptidase n=1 Tax=Mangrovimonas aestuarii TaxID=3018443 RepID=UPI002378743F|nr:M1 family aminopeptidase [Mangrovimonas aestuarii]
MKLLIRIVCILILCISCQKKDSSLTLLDNGIPKKMADFRSNQVSDVIYKLAFEIPKDKTTPIAAQLILETTIKDLSNPLFLDFRESPDKLISISVNSQPTPIHHEKQHVIIAPEHLTKGFNTITINFIAGELSLNRNDDYLYTLLVPDRASTLFPCFDQPNIKAQYLLRITAPKEWDVLCAAPEIEQIVKGDSIEHIFAKSEALSTYLFSFVAGKFNSTKESLKSFDMTMLYRETDSAKITSSTSKIFNIHQKSVDFLEAYTHFPFPFNKMDIATIPGFQYGGMEHVGAIQYRESSLFLDHTATESQILNRGKLIAHETSHMWFGDLVTMTWFNDVWMKEVFANFMADKIMNPSFPSINHNLSFLINHYPAAFNEDRTRGSNPIRQPLNNLNNAGSLYGNIIYHKAPIMMRQLERLIGESAFREGIREYINKYAYGNADWNQLIDILDSKTEIDLKQWSEVWVNQYGRPIFTYQTTYSNDTITSLTLSQHAEDGSEKIWPQEFSLGLVYPDSTKLINVNSIANSVQILKALGLPKPESIVFNYNGLGYGVFPVDNNSMKKIVKIDNDVARAQSYLNCYENTLNGNLYPIENLELLKLGLASESNELIIKMLSAQTKNLFWTYLTDSQRESEQKTLEDLIHNQLYTNKPSNIKKTLFKLFSSIAYSKEGREKLFNIWNKTTAIPGLQLNENDYTDMAMTLALYEHPKAEYILETAHNAIRNPDKQKRFEFLLPALSIKDSVRDSFTISLKEEENREKESWVLSALGYIHHPLRQGTAIKHLQMSLDLLEEIQRTGDIFFPKDWLTYTIGQYSSQEAYDILEKHLESHPELNPSLYKKLMQATDHLYRVRRATPETTIK